MLIDHKSEFFVRPSNAGNFYIAILREGPEDITRLLGSVDMAREEILQKAQDEQLQVVGMSMNFLCLSTANFIDYHDRIIMSNC